MHVLFLKRGVNFATYDESFFSESEIPPSNYDEDIDQRIHNYLLYIKDNNIQTFTLPISFTDNFLEFSGLIFAHHVRLTRDLNYCDVPLIFYGVLDLEELLRLTPLSRILISSNVLYVNITKYSFKQIQASIELYQIKQFQLSDLLGQIHVDSPANYDTHHSTANEWALYRYFSLLENIENNTIYEVLKNKISELDYPKTLHFKYLEAFTNRQKVKKKFGYTPVIRGVERKRIGIIDDEINKGWLEFYDYILTLNKANTEVFKDFKKDYDKNFLITKILEWISEQLQKEDPIDLFIIDLRLHDDDLIEKDFEKLSGIQVIKFIKNENPGIQIVVSTASNKVWNFQKCLENNVNYYSIKESPETYNTRTETKELLDHLCKQIENASDKTFLANFYRDIKYLKKNNSFNKSTDADDIIFKNRVFGHNGFFDQLFKLIIINPSNEAILNHCLLLCLQILENYCELGSVGVFDFTNKTGKVCLKDNSLTDIFTKSADNKNIISKLILKRGRLKIQSPESRNTIVSFEVTESFRLFSDKTNVDTTTLVKIISVLSFRHNLDYSDIERIIELRYYRSNVAAHFTGNVKLENINLSSNDLSFLLKIYNQIFIEQDATNS
jgi:CheY-like chemotaxis protein